MEDRFKQVRTGQLKMVLKSMMYSKLLRILKKTNIESGCLEERLGGIADWLLAVVLCFRSGCYFSPNYLCRIRIHGPGYLSKTLLKEGLAQSAVQYLNKKISPELQKYVPRERVISRIYINKLLTQKPAVFKKEFV